jgi:hypothetical protein
MPLDWRNWVFYICIPTGCAVASAVYLWWSTVRGHPIQVPRASLRYGVVGVITLAVLAELLIGNYVILKRFSPFSHWAYYSFFSLVPIVSGCTASNLYVRTSLYTRTILAACVPILLYNVLFFFGELAHLATFYYSGGH